MHRYSILMTCYYLDLGSASDWLKIFLIQSEALPRSGQWFVISMEFLPSFLGNWLPQSWWLALRNVSCFLKTRFHWERSRSQNRNQKHRTLRTSENSVLILLIPLTTSLFTIKWKLGHEGMCIVISLSFRFCFRLWRKRSRKKMETFWFFRLQFRGAYDSAYDFDFVIFIRS